MSSSPSKLTFKQGEMGWITYYVSWKIKLNVLLSTSNYICNFVSSLLLFINFLSCLFVGLSFMCMGALAYRVLTSMWRTPSLQDKSSLDTFNFRVLTYLDWAHVHFNFHQQGRRGKGNIIHYIEYCPGGHYYSWGDNIHSDTGSKIACQAWVLPGVTVSQTE